MSRREDMFLDEVRDAKPSFRPSADEWVDSERGRHVLERVLAADRAASARTRAKRRRAAWWAGPRLVFAAGALVVVVLAVTLAVVFAGGSAEQGGVTQTTTPAVEQVTGAAAIADLMPLYLLMAPADHGPGNTGTSARIEQAVALGLLTREEASGAWASSPMTQGDYAVLLVKAFGSALPQGAFPEQRVDPQSTPIERQAISALMTSGIILPQDGGFVAGQALTKEVEDRLLGRVDKFFRRLLEQ